MNCTVDELKKQAMLLNMHLDMCSDMLDRMNWGTDHPKKYHNPIYSLWNFGKLISYHRIKK